MTQASLLPSNRTPFELAASTVSAERRALPTDLVKSVWNPDTCPADLLGWLAWQLSVDVWDDDWPETTKREACRNSFLNHRLKTTPAGIRKHVALAGSQVRRIVRPPGKGFMYPAMTPEQRRAWLDSLAQIRIYPFVNAGIVKSRMFTSGPAGKRFMSNRSDPTPLSGDDGSPISGEDGGALTPDGVKFTSGYTRQSRGNLLYGKRATLYDNGVEVDVRYELIGGGPIERVSFGGVRHRQWYGRGSYGHAFAAASQAAAGIVTIASTDDSPLFAIAPSVAPVNVQPQRVAQNRLIPLPRGVFGRKTFGRFMRVSFAPNLIYDRISLNDPNRMGSRRQTRNYYGHGRYGIPPYTAQLTIRVPMKRTTRRAARWMGVGYLKAPDMTALAKAIEAVRVSKAFRDTVLLNTTTYRVVKLGGSLKLGEFTLGDIIEVA